MAPGKHAGYSWWPAGTMRISRRREDRIRFCVSTHRNAAGVYLIWRQVDRFKREGKARWAWFETERFDFQWADSKVEAREIAYRKATKGRDIHQRPPAGKLLADANAAT